MPPVKVSGAAHAPAALGGVKNPALGFTPSPPPAPPKPPAPVAPPAPKPVPDVRDGTYQEALARLGRQRDDTLTDLTAAGQRDDQDVAAYIRQLAEARTGALTGTKTNANRQGLFYSGILGQRLDDTNKTYDAQQTEQQAAYARRQSDRATAQTRAGESYAEALRQAEREAVERQVQRDLESGLGVEEPAPTPTPAVPVPAAARPKSPPSPAAQAKARDDAYAKALAQAALAKSKSRRKAKKR